MGRPSVGKQKATLAIGAVGNGAESARLVQAIATDENTVLAWRAVYCSGYDVAEDGTRKYHHMEAIPCGCKPGPQWRSLSTTADEILCAGGKGSSKSEATFGFIMRGNLPAWRSGKPSDLTYLNSRHYNFLVIRRTAKDLDDWFRRFSAIVEPMGARCTENPMRVTFPSGATGVFCHLEDWKSIMALQGKRFVRIVCEEVGQIPEEGLYVEAIYLAAASAQPDLHPQIMLTTNPGGPGESWLVTRFMKQHGGMDDWPSDKIWKDPTTGKTRVWIHSTVLDNPYYMAGNAEYAKSLESLEKTDPVRYKRFFLGEFGVRDGQYFERFRRKHREGEPANAVHVVKPTVLKSWWARAIACDWGYSHNSAVYFGCWTPEQQLHVFKELLVNRVGTVELGARIAEMALPELRQMENPHMALYLSHDAFHRTDYTNTEAELIQRGIEAVLGGGTAFVASPTIDESTMGENEAWESVRRRSMREGAKAAITVLPAGGTRKRKPGWQLIREYLRWWSLNDTELSGEAVRRVLETQGTAALAALVKAKQDEAARVLPVLQVWENCTHLIKWLESAVEADNDKEDVQKADGDDAGDALNYLVSNFKFADAVKPREVWIADRVRQRVSSHAGIDSLVMANIHAEEEWRRVHTARAIAEVPRFGMRPRLRVQ